MTASILTKSNSQIPFLNTVQFGDNATLLKGIPDCSIDLVYLDPPFFTGSKLKLRDRTNGKPLSFDDVWDNHDKYLQWMKIRLIELRRVLKNTGSIYLHCDWHASHLLRLLLDEIFTPSQFRAEIIWAYRRWSNSRRSYLRSHEVIYFYSKSDEYKFNVQYEDYSFTTNVDQIWQKRMRDLDNKSITPKLNGKYVPLHREKHGIPMRDVWEIPYLNPKASERTGYPTQKPIDLLLRIIDAGSDIGDIVLDPVCGSGTTLVASQLRDRRWIGIDDNKDAVRITKERLKGKIWKLEPTKHDLQYNLALFLKLPRDEKIQQLARLLGMNIAYRNSYIDGFLKRTGKRKSVSVRYIENEVLGDALESFVNASVERGVDLGLVILPRIDPREKDYLRKLYFDQLKTHILSFENLIKNPSILGVLLNEPQSADNKNSRRLSSQTLSTNYTT